LSKSTIVVASVDYFVAGVVGATSGEADIVSVWYSFVIQMRGLAGRLIGYNAYVRSPAGRLLAVLCLLKQLVVTAVASERRKYQGFESVISEPGTVDAGGTAPLLPRESGPCSLHPENWELFWSEICILMRSR